MSRNQLIERNTLTFYYQLFAVAVLGLAVGVAVALAGIAVGEIGAAIPAHASLAGYFPGGSVTAPKPGNSSGSLSKSIGRAAAFSCSARRSIMQPLPPSS